MLSLMMIEVGAIMGFLVTVERESFWRIER